MADKKLFRCPRCRHSEGEKIPNRAHCPRCGYSIVRPERDYANGLARCRLSHLPF